MPSRNRGSKGKGKGKGKGNPRPGARSRKHALVAIDRPRTGRMMQLQQKLPTMLGGLPVRCRVYLGQQPRSYLGVAVSMEQAPSVLQRALAAVARRVSGDVRQVLADGSPVVKKSSGHPCCHGWILLFGERRAWRLSSSLLHHRKVDGQRVPYLWIQGRPAAVWAVCTHFSP